MLDISPRNIDMFQLSLPDDMQGVFVQNVLESSPAMEAGILAGDVIVEWDGKPVRHTGDLSLAVATAVSDSKTVATIVRKKQRHTVVVTVGRRPNLATAIPSWKVSQGR